MILRNKLKEPKRLMMIGLVFLLVGNVANAVAQRLADDFWRGVIHAVMGTAWGVAFGCLLLFARLKSKENGECKKSF